MREEPAGFAQARRVVSDESIVDQVDKFGVAGDRPWIDSPAAQKFALIFRQLCLRKELIF